mmetsp:Transcript_22396/g.67368  ORF Transcript_22396/g.67368 Transcript_22396/m.67368 type:complete len:378 (-) Transcript_22396:2426-3559(-)
MRRGSTSPVYCCSRSALAPADPRGLFNDASRMAALPRYAKTPAQQCSTSSILAASAGPSAVCHRCLSSAGSTFRTTHRKLMSRSRISAPSKLTLRIDDLLILAGVSPPAARSSISAADARSRGRYSITMCTSGKKSMAIRARSALPLYRGSVSSFAMTPRSSDSAIWRSTVSFCLSMDRTTENKRPTRVWRLTKGIVRGPTALSSDGISGKLSATKCSYSQMTLRNSRRHLTRKDMRSSCDDSLSRLRYFCTMTITKPRSIVAKQLHRKWATLRLVDEHSSRLCFDLVTSTVPTSRTRPSMSSRYAWGKRLSRSVADCAIVKAIDLATSSKKNHDCFIKASGTPLPNDDSPTHSLKYAISSPCTVCPVGLAGGGAKA